MSSLADKMKRAAALMRGAGEEKKEINTALGVSSSAPIAETKAAAVEHQTVITETKAALNVPASEPITKVTTAAVEHKETINVIRTAAGIPASAPLSTIRNTVQNDYNNYNQIKTSSSFYKCASVDTENNKWGGYKVSIDSETGVWSFAETETPDLPYDKLIPQVGKVYDANCTFMASGFDMGLLIPSDGLVFYAPLSTDYKDTVNGLEPTQTTGSFTTKEGVACLYLDGTVNTRVLWTGGDFLPRGSMPMSLFCKRYLASNIDTILYGFGSNSDMYRLIGERRGASVWTPRENSGGFAYVTGVWGDIAITKDGSGNVVIYKDGVSVKTITDTNSYPNDKIFIGSMPGLESERSANGYFAHFAIYNRVLTADEILDMHNNLMPS